MLLFLSCFCARQMHFYFVITLLSYCAIKVSKVYIRALDYATRFPSLGHELKSADCNTRARGTVKWNWQASKTHARIEKYVILLLYSHSNKRLCKSFKLLVSLYFSSNEPDCFITFKVVLSDSPSCFVKVFQTLDMAAFLLTYRLKAVLTNKGGHIK